jgi:branched-subunit amino acid ABC-type transport system permease component
MWIVIVSGLVSGGLYIAISLGVVLTFRFAHVLNFSQGAIATLSAYVAWQLVDDGRSIWLGWLVAIGVGAAVSVLLGLVVARYLADAPELLDGHVRAGAGYHGHRWRAVGPGR